MLPGGSRTICMIYHIFSGLHLYYADPAQPLTMAGQELDDLNHDLSDLSDISDRSDPDHDLSEVG